MPFIDRIVARAYSRATEIPERVQSAVLNIFPEPIKAHVQVRMEFAEGHGQIPITVVTAELEGKKDAKIAFDYLFASLSKDDSNRIIATIDRRLDNKCVLFLRLDKQEAFLGKLRLATKPDVISVKVYLRIYPRCNKETAVSFVAQNINRMGIKNGN